MSKSVEKRSGSSNVTHNNIITANNVIINYNNSNSNAAQTIDTRMKTNQTSLASQTPSSHMPPGIHVSGTVDMRATTDTGVEAASRAQTAPDVRVRDKADERSNTKDSNLMN